MTLGNLDKFTFGGTPAAVYLVDILNRINQQSLTRKISRELTSVFQQVNALEISHASGSMSTKNCAQFANLLSQNIIFSTRTDTSEDNIDSKIHLINNLTRNVMKGKIKSLIRRLQEMKKIEHRQKQILNPSNDLKQTFKDGKVFMMNEYQVAVLVPKNGELKPEMIEYHVKCVEDPKSEDDLWIKSDKRATRFLKKFN